MALVFPNKTCAGTGQPRVIFPTTTLTSSYVAGTVASMDEHNAMGLEITYTKGDEDSMSVKIEDSIDGGTTFAQEVTKSASGGTTTVVPNEYLFTAASMATIQTMTILINPIKGDHVKVSAKKTNGSSPGTVAIRAIFGWV